MSIFNLSVLEKIGFGEEWANEMITGTLLKNPQDKAIILSKNDKNEAVITKLPFEPMQKLSEMQVEIRRLKDLNEFKDNRIHSLMTAIDELKDRDGCKDAKFN